MEFLGSYRNNSFRRRYPALKVLSFKVDLSLIISSYIFEVLHYLNRKTQGKHGFAALKVDMSKAYDRVEWDFLERIMLRMGFHERWVNLIMCDAPKPGGPFTTRQPVEYS